MTSDDSATENQDPSDDGHDHTHDDHDEHDDHGHGEDRPDYDPENVSLPERAPPLRSTAPQSDFTIGQVAVGFAVLLFGLVLLFGVPLALV